MVPMDAEAALQLQLADMRRYHAPAPGCAHPCLALAAGLAGTHTLKFQIAGGKVAPIGSNGFLQNSAL